MKSNKNIKIGIIGLGYVGLPLAVEFSKKYPTLGFDIKKERVDEINSFKDSTLEIEEKVLQNRISFDSEILSKNSNRLFITNQEKFLSGCNIYIITVPTPIDKNKKPLLEPLINATKLVSNYVKKQDIIVYESTVYPGATEEICVPLIESESNLKVNDDFYVGYSPERINPGDKKHTLPKILKVTSGSNFYSSKIIDNLYKSIIKAGTYLAPSIKVAEAAKVIENSQRDINIAFINELAKIFNLLDIDTQDVLNAAGTKWNFLNFKPGLVGGHCIGVDPYYLAEKAKEAGYYPKIILSGRELNDSMGNYIANQGIKMLSDKLINPKMAEALILGITFKENCPDIRNSKVVDVVRSLESKLKSVDVYDPWVNIKEIKKLLKINLIKNISKKYHLIILCVAHNEFLKLDISNFKLNNGILYDIKSVIKEGVDFKL